METPGRAHALTESTSASSRATSANPSVKSGGFFAGALGGVSTLVVGMLTFAPSIFTFVVDVLVAHVALLADAIDTVPGLVGATFEVEDRADASVGAGGATD